VASLTSRFYSCQAGFFGSRASIIHRLFLRENSKTIVRSRRSLTRGLGIRVTRQDLESCGLWFRELFYLEKWTEPPLPRVSFSEILCNDLPDGWSWASPNWVSPADAKEWRHLYAAETIANAWIRPVLKPSDAESIWWSHCDQGTEVYGFGYWVTSKFSKMLKLKRKDLWRWVYLRRNPNVFGRVAFRRGKAVPRPCLSEQKN